MISKQQQVLTVWQHIHHNNRVLAWQHGICNFQAINIMHLKKQHAQNYKLNTLTASIATGIKNMGSYFIKSKLAR
jgi:hypothetical protein